MQPKDFVADERPPEVILAQRRPSVVWVLCAVLVAAAIAGVFVLWTMNSAGPAQDAVTEAERPVAPRGDAQRPARRDQPSLATRFPDLGMDGRIQENPPASTIDENALLRSVRPDLAPPQQAAPVPEIAPQAVAPPQVAKAPTEPAGEPSEPAEDAVWPKMDEVKPPEPAAKSTPPKEDRTVRQASLPPAEKTVEEPSRGRGRTRLTHRVRGARAYMEPRPVEARQEGFRLPDALRPQRPAAN